MGRASAKPPGAPASGTARRSTASRDDLERLRRLVREADDRLIEVAAERINLCLEIGRFKAFRGIRTRDRGVERRVRANARQAAASRGLDPDMGEALVALLIEYSVVAQSNAAESLTGAGSET